MAFANTPRRVRIALNANGTGTVEMDGHDVSTVVSGVTIHGHVGDITRVTLELSPVAVELDADATLWLRENAAKPDGLTDTTTVDCEFRRWSRLGV